MPKALLQPIDPKSEAFRIEDIDGRALVVPCELLFLAFRDDREGTLAKLVLTIYRDAAWAEIRWEIHDGYRVRLDVGEAFVSFRSWERKFGGKRGRWGQLVQEVADRMGWQVIPCLAGDDRVEWQDPGHTSRAYPPPGKGHTPGGSKRPLGTIVRIPYYEHLKAIDPAFRKGLIKKRSGQTPGANRGRRSGPLPKPPPHTPSPQKQRGNGDREPWKVGKPARDPAEVNAQANEMHEAIEEEDYETASQIRADMEADREAAEERRAREKKVEEIRRLSKQRKRAERQGDASEVKRIGDLMDALAFEPGPISTGARG